MDSSNVSNLGVGTSALTQATQSIANNSNTSLGKEDFLKLLVAQIQNQDPLQPMDNMQFVAQLATFSNVEQTMNINKNLELLQVAQVASSNAQVAGLIGKEIEASGDVLNHTQQGPRNVNFDLAKPASDVTVKIIDGNNRVVQSIKINNRNQGLNTVTWDGRDSVGNLMPAGVYKVQVQAAGRDGGTIDATTRVRGVVSGITYQGGVPVLEVANTTVPVGDVISIREIQGGGANGGQ